MKALYSNKENRLQFCDPLFERIESQVFTITLESCENKTVIDATLSEKCNCCISIDFELGSLKSGAWRLCLTDDQNNELLSESVKVV